jgi:hypothetical protein
MDKDILDIGKRYMFKGTEKQYGYPIIYTITENPIDIELVRMIHYHPMYKEYFYTRSNSVQLMKQYREGTLIPIGINPIKHIKKHVFHLKPWDRPWVDNS